MFLSRPKRSTTRRLKSCTLLTSGLIRSNCLINSNLAQNSGCEAVFLSLTLTLTRLGKQGLRDTSSGSKKRKKNMDLQEKKMFIPCKPHRARAQPRSDLGRNRAVTVGIENKKQTKHFSILSTVARPTDRTDLTVIFHNIFFFRSQ